MQNGASFADSGDMRADALSIVNDFSISYRARAGRLAEFGSVAAEQDASHEVFSKQEHLLAELAGGVIWQAILDAGSEPWWDPTPDDPDNGLSLEEIEDAIAMLFGPDERLVTLCRAIGDLKPDQVREMLALDPEKSPLVEADPELREARAEFAAEQADLESGDRGLVSIPSGRTFHDEESKRRYLRLEKRMQVARKRARARITPILRRLQERARERDHM